MLTKSTRYFIVPAPPACKRAPTNLGTLLPRLSSLEEHAGTNRPLRGHGDGARGRARAAAAARGAARGARAVHQVLAPLLFPCHAAAAWKPCLVPMLKDERAPIAPTTRGACWR